MTWSKKYYRSVRLKASAYPLTFCHLAKCFARNHCECFQARWTAHRAFLSANNGRHCTSKGTYSLNLGITTNVALAEVDHVDCAMELLVVRTWIIFVFAVWNHFIHHCYVTVKDIWLQHLLHALKDSLYLQVFQGIEATFEAHSMQILLSYLFMSSIRLFWTQIIEQQ